MAPGELRIAAGDRTLTLRAERYLDVVQKIHVEGAGARQEMSVRFQPSGAACSLHDDCWRFGRGRRREPVATPVRDARPAGRRAPPLDHRAGAREWSSSVLVKAGETTTLGPLVLGAPEARLTVRSAPAGAEVTVAGAFRGRTPLQLSLPGGTGYDVLVTRAGHVTGSVASPPSPAPRWCWMQSCSR